MRDVVVVGAAALVLTTSENAERLGIADCLVCSPCSGAALVYYGPGRSHA